MDVKIDDPEEGGAIFNFDFDLTVKKDRETFRWFQILEEAFGSDEGWILYLADCEEIDALNYFRKRFGEIEPAMTESGEPPSLEGMSEQDMAERAKLLLAVKTVLEIIQIRQS